MPFDQDTAADEFGRTFAAMLKGSRAGPDLLDLWRAFAELQARERAFHDDRRAFDDDGAFLEHNAILPRWQRERPSSADPVVFMTRIQAMLVKRRVHLGLKWQELMTRNLPRIRQYLDVYRAEADPPPALRKRLIGQVRCLMREAGEFAVDQAWQFQQSLAELEDELFPATEVIEDGETRGRGRVTNVKSDRGGEKP